MRFPLALLLTIATVAVGCSSGPTLTLPYQKNELDVERLVVVSEVEQFDLSDDQVVTANMLDMHIEAREIIAETYGLEGDTVEAYRDIVLDTLLAHIVERLDVEDVRLASPDSSIELTRMRVSGRRRSGWGPPAPFVTRLNVPTEGSHFMFDSYSPDYVLILTEVAVEVEGSNVMAVPGLGDEEVLHYRVGFVVWDNQADEARTAGYAEEWVEKEGGLLKKKEFTREAVEESLGKLADELVRETRLPTN